MSSHDDPFAEPESHENHERYLITYADMITLLMALFIILFAIGQTDLEKYAKFADGAHQAVGGGSSLLTGGGALVDPAVAAASTESDRAAGQTGAEATAESLATSITGLLEQRGFGEATVLADDRGVVVTLPGDEITFAPGSWTLLPTGREAVRVVAAVLGTIDYDVVVNGHTDSAPMAPPLSNWELSTNRASAVVRTLMELGLPGDRLAAAGYADTRPIADNASPAGRAKNRRVEIVVMVPGVSRSVPDAPDAIVVAPQPFNILAPGTPATPAPAAHAAGH
jgi:chemotaxis protein MotB